VPQIVLTGRSQGKPGELAVYLRNRHLVELGGIHVQLRERSHT
jgi:hypothetical protein